MHNPQLLSQPCDPALRPATVPFFAFKSVTILSSTGTLPFRDPALVEMASRDGIERAWQWAIARLGPSGAAEAALGPFATALVDNTLRTILAVDRFAIETLCYRIDGDSLAIAQRADELAGQGPQRSAQIDPQAVFDYLYFHCIPSPRTIFRGVGRLPPGHCATFDRGQMQVEPYWVPRFEDGGDGRAIGELKADFRNLLRDAVATRLHTGVPACFLSGGTDSSTVAGMICQAGGAPAHTYSIGFRADGYDEMAYARMAARHFGTKHHEYYVTPDDLVRHIPAVAAAYDQPFGNSSALPSYCCALRAREDGVTRILAGDGGDELFAGNTRYAKQRVFDAYGYLPAALRSGLIEPMFGGEALTKVPLLRKGASYLQQANAPMPDRLQMYNLLLRLGPKEVLTADFLATVDEDGPLAQQREVYGAAQTSSELNRALAFDWRYTLAESDLPKVTGTTRLAGIEVRYPLLDERLLDFSLRLHAHHKLKGLKLRWFFKEALRGFLPDEILTKKKQGFGLPFGVWLLQHAGLKRLADDSVRAFAARRVVRQQFIADLLERRVAEHPGYFGEMVWIIMMLELWLQHHAPDWKM
jgi:asparagine synthase (glutamine-hydrolysing)